MAVGLIAASLANPLRAAQPPSPMAVSPMPPADYATTVLAGIPNQGRNRRQPYVTAGDRAYLIGTQDGNFPDMGQHIPGEMGGLWLPPIKLIDGFRARLVEGATGKDVLLAESKEMIAYPYGDLFRYGRVLDQLDVERFQFSPDHHPGLIIQYRLRNSSARVRRLRFEWSVKTDLRPTWGADRLGIRDAPDVLEWHSDRGLFIAKDRDNPWFCVWGALVRPREGQRDEHPAPIRTRGLGVTGAARYTVVVAAHSFAILTFVVSGSNSSQQEAIAAYDELARSPARLLRNKVARYRARIDRARIRIPDRHLQEVYDWSRINMQWLIRDVPGVGRGLSAGFMEYPWWFGTETYSLQALISSGDSKLAMQTLRLLRDQSYRANGNGRIAHEITTDGQVTNRGNTQETAQFVMTVGKVFQWTGDRAFAKQMYPAVTRAVDWLLGNMDRHHDLFPQGYGITEILNLNVGVIDVAVYTQQALEAAARVAEALHDTVSAHRDQTLAAVLKARINQRFWIEKDGTYGDFYGTRSQAVSAAEGSIEQIELKGIGRLTRKDRGLITYYQKLKREYAAMPPAARAWITNENWVIATPMETGIAPRGRALQLLDKVRRDSGPYGPYLSAVDRQGMMTISTGVAAVAEAQYGRTDDAMWYVDKIRDTFNRVTPGSMSEMMPDRGCFTIAWTAYGIVVPLIEHVFGIQPDAANRTIVFEPHLPRGWQDIAIEDLPVGTNSISFSRTQTRKGILYEIDAKEPGWHFVLRIPTSSLAQYSLNGTPIKPSLAGIPMDGTSNRLLIAAPGAVTAVVAPERLLAAPAAAGRN